MNRLHILIVEDEILIAELISTYLQEMGHVVLAIAISYEEALKEYNLRRPDLILLDIRLYGDKSGIDLAYYLASKNENLPIIYLSSQYDQRTLKYAMETLPYGYLTKPIRKETLWTSIETAYHLFKSKNQPYALIEVFDGKNYHQITIDDIIYIESDHVYANIFLVNGQQIYIRNTLKQLLELINNDIMLQCHRSFLVNRNFVKTWNADSVKMINDKIIPISRSKKNVMNKS